jgi:arsenite oxidase small subunit
VTSMTPPNDKGNDKIAQNEEADPSRRDFLKVAMTLSAVMAFGGVGTVLKAISNPASPGVSSLTFPRVKVAEASLSVNSPIYFNYPLDSEPNFLVKLGQKATGGVGADQDIVAFSQICQHIGCYIAYESQGPSGGPVGNCPCHGSVFDLLQSARVIAGPSPRPLPQVQLEVDGSGNIFAKGMGPPTVFGHNTGSNDVSSDLQGGNIVG